MAVVVLSKQDGLNLQCRNRAGHDGATNSVKQTLKQCLCKQSQRALTPPVIKSLAIVYAASLEALLST